MTDMGHNENAVRLAGLAGDAQIALDKVARGEADAVAGWLAYGAALNEGRALFSGDREFGEWLAQWQVAIAVEPHERAAAMWAAANADQFEEARAAGNARTVRGIHDKWKKIEAERRKAQEEAERKAREEAERKRRAEEAEAARKAAAEAQANEQAARAAAAAAESEAEREAAEARAAEAAAAKAEAEAQAQAATAGPEAEDDEPAAFPDPEESKERARIRREFRRLTPEAQEEEFVNVREENWSLRRKLRSAKEETKEAKEALKLVTEADDNARRLAQAREQNKSIKFRLGEEQAKNARQQRRINKQDAEIKKLRERLEQQVVTL